MHLKSLICCTLLPVYRNRPPNDILPTPVASRRVILCIVYDVSRRCSGEKPPAFTSCLQVHLPVVLKFSFWSSNVRPRFCQRRCKPVGQSNSREFRFGGPEPFVASFIQSSSSLRSVGVIHPSVIPIPQIRLVMFSYPRSVPSPTTIRFRT